MSHKKSLSDAELAAFEASHDFEALLVQSAREMDAGKTRRVYALVVAACEDPSPSQAGFAVSARTLQQREQSRREPTDAAEPMIAVAEKMPEAFRVVDPDYKAPGRVVGHANPKRIRV